MSPEELRQQIAERLAKAFEQSTGSTWLYDKGADMADEILSLPAIRRALAIAEAVDNANELSGKDGRMSVDGWTAESARTAIVHLRRVGLNAGDTR